MTIAISIFVIVVIMFVYFTRSKKEKNGLSKTIKRESQTGKKENIRIVHVSDIHYLSPGLTDYGKAFNEKINSEDGKVMRYIDQIVDAFVYEMIDKKPDVVVVSGDLTYNGEKESHVELAKKFMKLKEKGIDVFVIPGNHDIDNETASSYFKDKKRRVENVNEFKFREIYREFGYGDDPRIVSRAKNSLSYVARINDYFNFIMIDTSTGKNNHYITNSNFSWIDKELKRIKASNERAVSVTHQNILAHNKMFVSGYKIDNSSKLVELYNRYNVRINLSGHMHIQHIAEKDKVYDIAVSAISIYPNQYGELVMDYRDNIDYSTSTLNVSYWTELYGRMDKNLVNFTKYSKDYFINSIKKQTELVLRDVKISEEDRYRMINFMIETNIGYFSGTMNEHPGLSMKSDSYTLWQKYCEKTYLASYLNSVYVDINKNQNQLSLI